MWPRLVYLKKVKTNTGLSGVQAYGGVKDTVSGLERKGVWYAMEDPTEERVLMMAGPGQL